MTVRFGEITVSFGEMMVRFGEMMVNFVEKAIKFKGIRPLSPQSEKSFQKVNN